MPSCNTYHLTWVSLTLGVGYLFYGCSSKAQSLLLTLEEGYLLTATLPDLQRGIAPLGPPAPTQPRLLGRGVAPPGRRPWPQRSWTNLNTWSLDFLTGNMGSMQELLMYTGK